MALMIKWECFLVLSYTIFIANGKVPQLQPENYMLTRVLIYLNNCPLESILRERQTRKNLVTVVFRWEQVVLGGKERLLVDLW